MKEDTEKVKTVVPQILIFCSAELLDRLLPSKEGVAQCKIPKERQAGYAYSGDQVCQGLGCGFDGK